MPLVPGPFTRGKVANIDVESAGYNFTDDATALQGDLAAISADWEPVLSWLTAAASDSGDVALGLDLGGLLSLTDEMGRATRPTMESALTAAYTQADQALNAAIAFAPNQAWMDPGAPYVPPDSALTLTVPTLPPGQFELAPIVNVGGYSGGAPVAVVLTNTTRYGATNFTVGDNFQVTALGPVGAEVTARSTLNGEDLGESDWGAIQPGGQLIFTGTMGPENVGAWSQRWYVGGVLESSLNFIVTNT